MSSGTDSPGLVRALSTPLVVLYGLGTTIGAGIYALVGKVAGVAGMGAPLAFAVASLLAAFTALTFAELSSRYPRSAGEAVYIREGLRRQRLALGAGLLVVISGCVSAAAVANGFSGYVRELVELPRVLLIALLGLAMGGIAGWGVRVSVGVAAAITVLEIGGLLGVLWVARDSLGDLARFPELVTPPGAGWVAVLSAALLAFYAFLGFEDMVNVAEEIRDVRRALPRAIVITLVLTTGIYVLLASVCVLSVAPSELAASDAPLALVFERSSGQSPAALSLIGAIAMVNGALIQLIMASRVLYGLANEHGLPDALRRIHPRTRTPLLATGLVTALILVLAVAFPIEKLAEATSVLLLVVFTGVNLALVRLKLARVPPGEARTVPIGVPICGFAISAAFLAFELVRLLGSLA